MAGVGAHEARALLGGALWLSAFCGVPVVGQKAGKLAWLAGTKWRRPACLSRLPLPLPQVHNVEALVSYKADDDLL